MKRGVIVLVPFPFTDLADVKVRPALVVSRSDRADTDVIVAFIGSYRGRTVSPADVLIESAHQKFALTGLKVDSLVRCDKLVTLESAILLGELGELPTELLRDVDDKIRFALELR